MFYNITIYCGLSKKVIATLARVAIKIIIVVDMSLPLNGCGGCFLIFLPFDFAQMIDPCIWRRLLTSIFHAGL